MKELSGIVTAALIGRAWAYAPHVAQQKPLGVQDTTNTPLVDSEELQSSISGERLLSTAQDLFKLAELSYREFDHPTRVIGSAGHTATLDYIWATISKLGSYYKLSDQVFPAYSGSVLESRLVLGAEVISNVSAMSLTPPTKDKEPVHGDLVTVANSGCSASDYPASVKNNLAFIRRGECSFGIKSAFAGRAGAVAAVIYNNEKGSLHGTMGTPELDHVATFGISLEEAEPYLKKLGEGKSVDGIAYMNAFVSTIHTKNIVAETVGGDKENCFMLGAHSDSVPEGPGINDDGSGTLSLLEVATQLIKYRVNNCVRFAWWAAEEEGLVGSDYYATMLSPEENKKVRLFADYDMMGSPNYAYQIYNATNVESPAGSEQLRNLYADWYDAHGLNYTFIPFDGRSDYDGFIRAGIPAGGIATGAEGVKTKKEVEKFGGKSGEWYDHCYHQLCDDVANVDVAAWEINTKLIAHSVATYAVSFERFPERESIDAAGLSKYEKSIQHHGGKLFI